MIETLPVRLGSGTETAETLSLERITLPVPSSVAAPARRRLPVAPTNVAPLATRTLSAAAIGLAAEFVLRALVNGSTSRLLRAARSGAHATRTVTTEVTVVERLRRR